MKIHRQVPDGMQVHAGTDTGECVFFDGENIETARETGRYIIIWDPPNVRDLQ